MRKDYTIKAVSLMILFVFFTGYTFAQQRTITGTVVAQSDGSGIPGVSVLIIGTMRGTTTDVNGKYSIAASNTDSLSFSYVGYVTQNVYVGNRSVIDIALKENIGQLAEVVVIGYGEKSKTLLTSSVSSVKADAIQDLEVPSVEGVLKGRAAGVTVRSGTGQPGVAPEIRVRGGSSIRGNNDPLFIIDGVQRSPEDFNPEDVASIEILKDASATAIYGARASNGVILVTTKSGKTGKPKFNVDLRTSFSSLMKKLDLLNAEDYIRIERTGLTRSFLDENSAFGAGSNATGIGNPPDGNFTLRALGTGETVPPGYKSMTDPITGETLIFQDVDWQDVTYRPTRIDNAHISVSGGSSNIKYYAGLSNYNEQGIAKGTSYKRFSLQSRVDFNISDKFRTGTNINYTHSNSDAPYSTNTYFGRAARLAPTTRRYYEDGSVYPGSSTGLPNPEWYAANFLNNFTKEKVNLGGYAEYDILKGLVAKGTINGFLDQDIQEAFIKATTITSARNTSADYNKSVLLQLEATLNYTKSFGNHNLSILVGASNLNTNYFNLSASGEGGPTNSVRTVNAAPTNQGSSARYQDKLIGYFGRVSYDYARRYLFTGTLRRDGSSRFGFDNQVGYFPSFSAGWRVSEEPFFSVPFISELKLRASWGQTANNNIPGNFFNSLYISQGIVDPTLKYNGQAAARTTDLPNPNLGWETTSQADVGFDLGLFNNRLNFDLDYYRKVTSGLLFNNPLPNTSGFSSIIQNVGDVEFKGLELDVASNIIKTSTLSWDAEFNIAFNTNKVLSLPDNGRDRNRIGGYDKDDGTGIGGIAEGEPIRQIVGWKMVKVYPTTAEAQEDGQIFTWANDRTSTNGIDYRQRVGGDVKWEDLNGDNIIDNNDLQVLGYATPKVTGGLANTLNYKGFELYVFLDFQTGHHIYDSHRARMNSNSQGNINGTADLLRAWNKEGDVTDIPRFVFFDYGNARNHDLVGFGSETEDGGLVERTSSLYTEKGDFLAIRNVRLSYNFPSAWIQRLSLNSAKIYVMGQNLHYFTEYQGYNPEVGALDLGRYPLFKSISLGLNVGF